MNNKEHDMVTRKIPGPLVIILAVFLIAPLCAETNIATNTALGKKSTGSVILVTTSVACQCTLKRCQSFSMEIRSILANARYKDFLLEEIDYSKDKEKAEIYLAKCRMFFMPVLMVLDESGTVCYSSSSALEQDKIIAALDRVLSGDCEASEGEKP
jgi:hypothetical protein